MPLLVSETLPIAAVDAALCARLFAIFTAHYECVERAVRGGFGGEGFRPAAARHGTGEPRGFSTQKILRAEIGGEPVRAIFSGDTIIARAAWGEQELVRAWCRFAGRVRVAESSRLFWFLISKGHRTYLYLPLFFRAFIPKRDTLAAPELTRLRDALAHFPASRGRLAHPLAEIPPGRVDDPDVQFFLAANPGYARGDELVCLAEISPQNMRGLAARMLAEGEAALEQHA